MPWRGPTHLLRPFDDQLFERADVLLKQHEAGLSPFIAARSHRP